MQRFEKSLICLTPESSSVMSRSRTQDFANSTALKTPINELDSQDSDASHGQRTTPQLVKEHNSGSMVFTS